MPVYDAETYLDEAVTSVLGQDYPNWELLAVNDGSTDGSLTILEKYLDKRIRIFNQPNQGVSCARNVALKSMRGNFFCFLDADDVLTKNSLSLRLNCFVEDSIAFADGMVEIFDATMSEMTNCWIPNKTGNLLKSLVRLDARCFFGPTWMIRRDPSITYAFDETLTHGEDLMFYISVAHHGKYTFTEQPILRYRNSPRSAMKNLVGLANGYSLLKEKISQIHQGVSWMDRLVFTLKVRRIMFQSFLKAGRVDFAFRYVLFGSL